MIVLKRYSVMIAPECYYSGMVAPEHFSGMVASENYSGMIPSEFFYSGMVALGGVVVLWHSHMRACRPPRRTRTAGPSCLTRAAGPSWSTCAHRPSCPTAQPVCLGLRT